MSRAKKAGKRFTQRRKHFANWHPLSIVIPNGPRPEESAVSKSGHQSRHLFGLPVLKDSRLTTGFLASRHRGGDSVPSIAKSYGRPVAEIEEAIEWELGRPVKKAA